LANTAPGVIFAEDNNVAPDVVWVSRSRLRTALGADSKLHSAPESAVEVLSPGARILAKISKLSSSFTVGLGYRSIEWWTGNSNKWKSTGVSKGSWC